MWESFRKCFIAARLSRAQFCPIQRPMNSCQTLLVQFGPDRSSHLRSRRSAEASGAGQSRSFQDLRAMSMTKDERTWVAIPHKGKRDLSCRTRFSSPRGTAVHRIGRRAKTRTRRNRHGFARAIEDLRGVRLSLVPCPDPRECLLQRVRGQTEGLSIAGEPETAWTPNRQAAHQSLGGG